MNGNNSPQQVVILGAGHAGGATALALRQLGFAGAITAVGAESLPPYERPSLSKEWLQGTETEPRFLATPDKWQLLGVTLRLGVAATAIDRSAGLLHLADGTRLPWDCLVLATGGAPRRLPMPDHPAVLTLRHTEDAGAIRRIALQARRAVVIGGGVIGLEAAASLRRLGIAVAVIEQAPRLMARNVPQDMAGRIAALHRREGVELLLGEQFHDAVARDDGLEVRLAGGRALAADLVIPGIGILPETRLAVASGLECPDGVPVDAGYVSADPRVLAVGDVARPPGGRQESWAHAQASALAAARSILGLPPEAAALPWFWTTQFDSTLQVAGEPLAAQSTVGRGNLSLYLTDGRVLGAAALDAPRDFAAARRLIGRAVDPTRAADPALDLRRLALEEESKRLLF